MSKYKSTICIVQQEPLQIYTSKKFYTSKAYNLNKSQPALHISIFLFRFRDRKNENNSVPDLLNVECCRHLIDYNGVHQVSVSRSRCQSFCWTLPEKIAQHASLFFYVIFFFTETCNQGSWWNIQWRCWLSLKHQDIQYLLVQLRLSYACLLT